jgi:putative ABC transport system ATP-binding protein
MIIFGDEPTGALNSKSAEEIMNIFSRINADGTAVMLVTHDAKVAVRTERIIFMRDGKIVSEMRLPKFSGLDIDDRIKTVTAKMYEIGI